MTRGLLDLPGPLLDAIDRAAAFAHLPAFARVLLWGGAAGALGMTVYRACSPQARLVAVRDELAAAQRDLLAYDGDFAGLWPRARRQLTLSLRQLALTLAPALLASVPVFFLLPWLADRYSYLAPEPHGLGSVCVQPATAPLHIDPPQPAADVGCWTVTWPERGAALRVTDAAGTDIALPSEPLRSVIGKFNGFSRLAADPAYLADRSPADVLRVELPEQTFLPVGPGWLRGYELPFFVGALVVSVVLKRRWKVV